MGPNAFQSSFIPKGQIATTGSPSKKTGLLGVVAASLFVLVIVLTAGLYAYKWITKNSIVSLQKELAAAEAGLDTETIQKMSAFSRKLASGKKLIIQHKAISNFLTFLSANTVKNIEFTDFNYTTTQDSGILVSLSGESLDYASLALEQNILEKESSIKQMSFGNLSLVEGGRVSFDLSVTLDPKMVLYTSVATSSPVASDAEEDIKVDDIADIDLSIPDLDNL